MSAHITSYAIWVCSYTVSSIMYHITYAIHHTGAYRTGSNSLSRELQAVWKEREIRATECNGYTTPSWSVVAHLGDVTLSWESASQPITICIECCCIQWSGVPLVTRQSNYIPSDAPSWAGMCVLWLVWIPRGKRATAYKCEASSLVI